MKTCSIYRGYRFPPDIIAQAVWLYHRFALSLRDVEDLLAERGIEVSYETIHQWCARFGRQFARRIKARLGRRGDRWFLDATEFRGVSAGWVLPRRDGVETGKKVAVQGVCCELVSEKSLISPKIQGNSSGFTGKEGGGVP